MAIGHAGFFINGNILDIAEGETSLCCVCPYFLPVSNRGRSFTRPGFDQQSTQTAPTSSDTQGFPFLAFLDVDDFICLLPCAGLLVPRTL